MHIAIDARIISSSTGRYVEALVDNLQKIDTTNTYTVMVLKKDATFWKPTSPNFHVAIADFPNYSVAEQTKYKQFLDKLHPDLVHFCMPQQPLLYRGKSVTTVHDLTLVHYDNIDMNPLMYKARKQIFIRLLKTVIRRSKVIFTPTEYVRQDIIKFSSEKYAKKITKTHLGWDVVASKTEVIPELKDKDFVFFVGNAFPYKNVTTIVHAFTQLYQKYPDLHLGLAGKKDFFYEQVQKEVENLGIGDRVHFLGFISEGQKRWMFQNGKAYIIASLSEGFHIPGLEAMSEDCPVISSNATCLPEVYQKAAYYFDPHKTEELVEAIDQILSNKAIRTKLIAAGRKQLATFSWERAAKLTHEGYIKALEK